MTTEELLKPRYKVIAGYPNSEFEVGEIFPDCEPDLAEGFKDFTIKEMAKYPHLFRRMGWWAERTDKEIKSIQYLKLVKGENAGQVGKVDKWKGDPLYAIVGRFVWQLEYGAFEPATETEYNNYLNSKP